MSYPPIATPHIMNGSSLDTPMRIRTVKPEFWTHPVMCRQTELTQLLAIGLLNHSDDHGFFYADTALVRAAIRPFYELAQIQECLNALIAIGYIEIRDHETYGKIGRVVSFHLHQKIDRPQQSSLKHLFLGYAPNQLDDVSTNAREKECTGTGNREQGMEQGKEGNGELLSLKKKASKSKGTIEELIAFCKENHIPESDAKYLFHKWEGNGWINGNKPIRDWRATIRTWEAGGYLPSQKLSAVSTPPRGQIPVWKQIQTIEEQLETHPANPSFRGYRADKVTPEQKEHYENQKANLKRLKGELI